MKPGDAENTINLGSHGQVTAAILGALDFAAVDVAPLTVRLAGAPVILKKNGRPMASLGDVSGDGVPDLILHFATEDLRLPPDATEAGLVGETHDGRRFQGRDAIRVVGAADAGARGKGRLRSMPVGGAAIGSELAVRGIHPNPVVSGSTIALALPGDGPAVLEVWTVAGRLALRKDLGALGAGSHQIPFADAARLPRGAYIVRLVQDGSSATAKMSVLR